MSWRRLLAGAGLFVLALVLLTVLLLAWLLGTNTGSRSLWRGVSGAVDGLSAEAIEGRFSGPLSLQGLRYDNGTLRLTVESVDLQWSPAALWQSQLLLEQLHVRGLEYTQLQPAPPEEDSEGFKLPESFTLPVAVELQDIALRSLQYRSAPEAAPVVVDAAELVASFRGTDLSIETLSARGPLFRVQARASARTRDAYPVSASIQWRAEPPDLASAEGELSVNGDLTALRVQQSIKPPYQLAQTVELRDLLGDLHIDARLDINDTRLRDVGQALPDMVLSGALQARGTVAELTYEADLAANSKETGNIALRANGGLQDQILAIEQLLLTMEPGTARFEAAGQADLSGSAPIIALQGGWQDLRWPLMEQARITSQTGQVTLEGTTLDYSLTLNADLLAPGQTQGQLRLAGRGSNEAFALNTLKLELLDGGLSGRGEVRWSPAIAGSVVLSGEGLNPALLAPEFPGELQLELRADGGIVDGAADAQIETLSITGTLREQPLDLRVQGSLVGEQLQLNTLDLHAGSTRIAASGEVGERINLQWEIDSPDLGNLLPGASGTLAGDGSVGGRLPVPSVRGTLKGESLQYAQYQLARLALALDIDLERRAPSTLDLTVDQALLGGTDVSQISITGSGNRGDHQLILQADSSAGSAQLGLNGNLQDGVWQISLAEGQLQYGELAAWNLAEPQSAQVSGDAQSLERGCWTSGESSLCLQGSHASGDVAAALELEALPLAYFKSMLPTAFTLDGEIEASARFQQQSGAEPQAVLAVNTGAVELRTGASAAEANALLLGLEPSTVDVDFSDEGLLANITIPFVNGGGVDASAQVNKGTAPLAERPLRGKLALAIKDIGFLTALSPEIEQAAGSLVGDVNLSGLLAQPLPEGELSFDNGALELATPGLAINDIAVRARSAGQSRLAFDGQAKSGGGTLSLDGTAEIDGPRSRADIDIQGDNFQVFDTVDARVFVSPDLQLALQETGIEINGQLTIPTAEITPQKLPASAVSASGDQVIITGDETAVAAEQRELEAHIRIVLGDAVSVDGFGFKGRLAGGLSVDQVPGKPTLGTGELDILDGEYRAYGQGLVIDRGKILFAGGPIDQPGINVRAVRRPAENILVGVSVRGPMQEPDFSVFSEPGMTQSEQLSWLVLGRPLQSASEGESNLISQAALALGLQGGNYLTERFSGGLGFDEIGIETGSGEAGAASDVNQAAFVIGKYLSPDLFVSYGIGLFESVSTIKLEYSLDENWKLSTESSTLSSGGDVIYTIER